MRPLISLRTVWPIAVIIAFCASIAAAQGTCNDRPHYYYQCDQLAKYCKAPQADRIRKSCPLTCGICPTNRNNNAQRQAKAYSRNLRSSHANAIVTKKEIKQDNGQKTYHQFNKAIRPIVPINHPLYGGNSSTRPGGTVAIQETKPSTKSSQASLDGSKQRSLLQLYDQMLAKAQRQRQQQRHHQMLLRRKAAKNAIEHHQASAPGTYSLYMV